MQIFCQTSYRPLKQLRLLTSIRNIDTPDDRRNGTFLQLKKAGWLAGVIAFLIICNPSINNKESREFSAIKRELHEFYFNLSISDKK